jgi:hypothetical protein
MLVISGLGFSVLVVIQLAVSGIIEQRIYFMEKICGMP